MNLFFALLAIAAAGATVVIAVAMVVPGGRRLRTDIADAAPWLALAVAGTAMAGSLYYSEIADYTPCKLCWFQRICMYPLVVILAVGTRRRDRAGATYALPLSVIGIGIAAYHAQLQQFPNQESGFCTLDAPCTAKQVDEFGFLTIPLMALSGFVLITVLLISILSVHRTEENVSP